MGFHVGVELVAGLVAGLEAVLAAAGKLFHVGDAAERVACGCWLVP